MISYGPTRVPVARSRGTIIRLEARSTTCGHPWSVSRDCCTDFLFRSGSYPLGPNCDGPLGACRELAPSKQESTTYEPSLVCKLLILGCRLLIPDRLLETHSTPLCFELSRKGWPSITAGRSCGQLNDPRQSRGLISVSPSKGPVKSRLKAADAPTPCSAPPNAAPPAPAAKCIPARIVCPSPPWKRNSLALRNSSLSNGVSVPESSGQSRLHSSP